MAGAVFPAWVRVIGDGYAGGQDIDVARTAFDDGFVQQVRRFTAALETRALGVAPSLPGAASAQETLTMFDSDFDPVTPATGDLIAELGLDPHSVRDAIADDRTRRCPDREALADRRER